MPTTVQREQHGQMKQVCVEKYSGQNWYGLTFYYAQKNKQQKKKQKKKRKNVNKQCIKAKLQYLQRRIKLVKRLYEPALLFSLNNKIPFFFFSLIIIVQVLKGKFKNHGFCSFTNNKQTFE